MRHESKNSEVDIRSSFVLLNEKTFPIEFDSSSRNPRDILQAVFNMHSFTRHNFW